MRPQFFFELYYNMVNQKLFQAYSLQGVFEQCTISIQQNNTPIYKKRSLKIKEGLVISA